MITIVGAGGAIGNELVKLLAATNQPFRLVGRNPKATRGATETQRIDLPLIQTSSTLLLRTPCLS